MLDQVESVHCGEDVDMEGKQTIELDFHVVVLSGPENAGAPRNYELQDEEPQDLGGQIWCIFINGDEDAGRTPSSET